MSDQKKARTLPAMSRQELSITAEGQRALDDGTITDPRLMLIIELAQRTQTISEQNMIELCEELVDHYGCPETALEALRSGAVDFTKTEYH
jgi:hypothetical protein